MTRPGSCEAAGADGAPWITQWLDRHADGALAHKTALIESDTGASIGYRALRDAVAAMNGRFAELGVAAGDVVLLCAYERIDLVVALLAALQRGAIAANVSAQASADDHVALIARLEPQWIVRDCGVEAFEAALERLGGHAADTDTPAQALRCQPAYPRSARSAHTDKEAAASDEPGAPTGRLCLFTSGSTGTPRAVLHGVGDLIEANRLYADAVLGLRDSDVLFSTSRLSFAYGFNSLHFALSRGATAVLAPRQARAENVAAALARHRPSVFFAVPTVYRLLLERVPEAVSSFDSVRLWVSAGETLPRPLFAAWRAATGRDVIDGIGTTETLCTFISNRPDACVAGSTGTAVEGFELALLDAEGRPVAEGEIGRLHVRGPTLAAGYWKEGRSERRPGRPGRDGAAFHDGWFDTRDLFRRDAAGRYLHLGRANEVFKSGGLWVSPLRIEQVLGEHPAVHECAIVPASEWGGLNRIHAFVVLRTAHPERQAREGNDALARELVAYAKQRLARHEHPHHVRFVDALPRSANGKLQRTHLHL